MALDPIPHVIQASGDAAGAPAGSIPVALYGSAPTTVADVDGLQAIITDLTSRIEDLESPEA